MEIHWHHAAELDLEQRGAAEARIRSLEGGHSDLIDVRISATTTPHHRHGDQEVRIVAQVRGSELVVTRSCPDLGLALDQALDTFERDVRRMRDRRRERRHETPARPPELGIVDRVLTQEGYGFILTDGGDQVYFHRNAVRHGLHFDGLTEGQRIALNFEGGEKGLQATAVFPPPPDIGGI